MNIDLTKITPADIHAASFVDDVDAAVASLQERAGITDGGVASLLFACSDFNWIEATPDERKQKLAEYVKLEAAVAATDIEPPPPLVMLYVWGGYDQTIIGPFLSKETAAKWAQTRFAGSSLSWAAYEMCRPENYPTRVDDGEVETPASFTFEQFQLTRRWCDDLGKALSDATWEDRKAPGTGFLYLTSFYIDDVDSEWSDDLREQGAFHLVLDEKEWIDDDLETLERKLYEYALASGATIDDATPYYDDQPIDVHMGDTVKLTTLREFISDNHINDAEERKIVAELVNFGEYDGGGGASPEWRIVLVDERAPVRKEGAA